MRNSRQLSQSCLAGNAMQQTCGTLNICSMSVYPAKIINLAAESTDKCILWLTARHRPHRPKKLSLPWDAKYVPEMPVVSPD